MNYGRRVGPDGRRERPFLLRCSRSPVYGLDRLGGGPGIGVEWATLITPLPLLFALSALNLAFGLYLFISLRRSPECFLGKAGFRSKAKQQVSPKNQYYDAFADRQQQFVR